MFEQGGVEDELDSNGYLLGLSTAVEAEYMTTSSPNQSGRRAFSLASSSTESFSVRSWPQGGIGLRRAFLIGRRGSPSTPVPSWKVSDNSVVNAPLHRRHPLHLKHDHIVGGLHISARKLAAALWELQKLPGSGLKENLGQEPQVINSNASPTKKKSTLHGQPLSPESSYVSTGSHVKPPVYPKLRDHGKAHARLERRRGQQAMLLTAASKKEMTTKEGAISPSESGVLSSRDAFSRFGCGPTTTSELLNLLHHVQNLEERQVSSMSLVVALRMELEDARTQLQELLSNESLHHKGFENISRRIAEERALLHDQEEQTIRIAVESAKQELDDERKSKLKLEMLNKESARELRDSKKSVVRAMEELAREKKARQLIEEVCDELSREIGQDKTTVEELKLESVKVREEVEEERKMLQMAEVWREERVQMKLMDAKFELEEKNTALDKLRGQLEGFLETKRASDLQDGQQGRVTNDEKLGVGRPSSVEVVVGRNLLNPFHSRDERRSMLGRNSVDLSCSHGVKENVLASNSDDDLHYIEINRDPLAKGAIDEGGLRSFQLCSAEHQERRQRLDEQERQEHLDEQTVATNRLDCEGVEKSRSARRGRKERQEAKAEEIVPVDVSQSYQWWTGHSAGGGSDDREWRGQKQQGESSNSGQSDTKDSRSPASVTSKEMLRSISEKLTRTALRNVGKRASKSCEWQQQPHDHVRWQPSLPEVAADYGSNRVSSPTRKWNNHMPSPDFETKSLNEAVDDGHSLKTKLSDAKLEGQRAEQKRQ